MPHPELVKGVTLDRYYTETLGGHGWPKCHFVIDRATVPHTVVSSRGWLKTRKIAEKVCATLNEQAGDLWTVDPVERDSLTRLREWAASTRAFTEHAYDLDAPAALVREAA